MESAIENITKIIYIIIDVNLTKDTDILETVSINSIQQIQIIRLLEQQFNVFITDLLFYKYNTINEIAIYLTTAPGTPPPPS